MVSSFIMIAKAILLLTCVVCCECVYSSFWAPLFDPRVLGYRVETRFDPGAGRAARGAYRHQYGYRGEMLIADLGNGKGLTDSTRNDKADGGGDRGVQFSYT